MRLYVVRHGKAERDSASGLDEDRELKKRGVRQARWLGERLAGDDAAPTLIVTSPYARARQTADRLVEACACDLEEEDALTGGPADVIALIESHVERGRDEPMAIVGHNPTLSDVVERLCQDPATEGLWLRTGEAAILDVEPGYAAFAGLLRLDDA